MENAKPYYTMHKHTKWKNWKIIKIFWQQQKGTWKKIVEDDDFNKAMYLQK